MGVGPPQLWHEEDFYSDKAINNLAMNKIPIRPFFRPLSTMPAYRKYKYDGSDDPKNSEYLFRKGMTLPSHYEWTKSISIMSQRI